MVVARRALGQKSEEAQARGFRRFKRYDADGMIGEVGRDVSERNARMPVARCVE